MRCPGRAARVKRVAPIVLLLAGAVFGAAGAELWLPFVLLTAGAAWLQAVWTQEPAHRATGAAVIALLYAGLLYMAVSADQARKGEQALAAYRVALGCTGTYPEPEPCADESLVSATTYRAYLRTQGWTDLPRP
jgi:hypothetical protein